MLKTPFNIQESHWVELSKPESRLSVCAIYNSYVHTGKTDVQNVGVYIRNIAADSELITELFQDWNKTNILGQISRVESFKVLVINKFHVQILDI